MFVDSLTEEENPQPDCDPVWINQGGAAVFLCVKKVIKFSLFFLSIHSLSLSLPFLHSLASFVYFLSATAFSPSFTHSFPHSQLPRA